ncbi:MAG: flagellar filament capping protein FliD, partial [Campylobacterota bacterium]
KPIENKILENEEKQTALSQLNADIAGFKDTVGALSDPTLFANRGVDVHGTSVQATVNPGVDVQDMQIEVQKLAKNDVFQGDTGFATRESTVANEDSVLELTVGDSIYEIEVSAGTTLDQLRTKINDVAGESVTASIINTGQDDPYSLILKSDETGTDNKISMNVTSGALNTGFSNIQQAQDAEFKYNGISVTRSSNQVNDLVNGVQLTLLEENDLGRTTNIEINQDTSGLEDKMSAFVETYNKLVTQLDELTKFEEESGESGVFQGESTVNRLKSDLSSIATYISGDRESMRDFGVELGEGGKLTFEPADLQTKLSEGTEDIEQFFIGSYEEIAGKERLTDGVFTQFSDLVERYTDFSNGIFKNFNDQLTNEAKALQKERTTAIQRLDVRYETMAQRFAAYDNQIANMQNSFQGLQMQIEQQANGN